MMVHASWKAAHTTKRNDVKPRPSNNPTKMLGTKIYASGRTKARMNAAAIWNLRRYTYSTHNRTDCKGYGQTLARTTKNARANAKSVYGMSVGMASAANGKVPEVMSPTAT